MAALKKRLPKLEEELIADIQEWEKEHERTFLVDGVAFVGYINSQWAALSENDQIEKAERCKKTKTATRRRYGVWNCDADQKSIRKHAKSDQHVEEIANRRLRHVR